MKHLILRTTAQLHGKSIMYEVTLADGDVAHIDMHRGEWMVTFYSFRRRKFYWFVEDEDFDSAQEALGKISVVFP